MSKRKKYTPKNYYNMNTITVMKRWCIGFNILLCWILIPLLILNAIGIAAHWLVSRVDRYLCQLPAGFIVVRIFHKPLLCNIK